MKNVASPATTADTNPRRHGPYYDQRPALSLAATVREEPDASEIRRFCSAMSGQLGRPIPALLAELQDLPLPRGFLHVRLLISGTEEPFSRLTRRDRNPVNAVLIASAACQQQVQQVPWSRIDALDVVDRGVLDLALTYPEPTPSYSAARAASASDALSLPA